jgi:hypothetical protein
MQQMLRMRLGVPTTGETRCNCRTHVHYGGGRQFDTLWGAPGRGAHAWDSVPSAAAPGRPARRRRQDADHPAAQPARGDSSRRLPGARADLTVEVKARRRRRVPRHQVSGGQAEHARQPANAGEAVKKNKRMEGRCRGLWRVAGSRGQEVHRRGGQDQSGEESGGEQDTEGGRETGSKSCTSRRT